MNILHKLSSRYIYRSAGQVKAQERFGCAKPK